MPPPRWARGRPAVARPAPAPAARSTLRSGQPRRHSLPTRWAMAAPICTLGPSRPSASPAPIASTPPTNLTDIRPGGVGGTFSFNAASTCGMPLPEAYGENRRTSQAANATAAAAPPQTNKKPAKPRSWPTAITASLKRSASSSVSRKIAPSSPDAAPAMGARTASTSKPTNRGLRSVVNSGDRLYVFYQKHYRAGEIRARGQLAGRKGERRPSPRRGHRRHEVVCGDEPRERRN